MTAPDTRTIELDEDEARKVINALNAVIYTERDEVETTALDVRDLLEREFGYEDDDFREDVSLAELFTLDDRDDEHEIQLSRDEAAVVDRGLADLGADPGSTEAELIADLRDRFAGTFDLSPGHVT